MAWFLNAYECDRCGGEWTDEWSCMCDDECPHCGARDMTPYEATDLTTVIEKEGANMSCYGHPRPRSTIRIIANWAVSRQKRRQLNSLLPIEPFVAIDSGLAADAAPQNDRYGLAMSGTFPKRRKEGHD
jgi:hypothetical protein